VRSLPSSSSLLLLQTLIIALQGSHQAAWQCTSTQHYLGNVTSFLSTVPALLRACPSLPVLPKLILITTPTFPPVIGANDCRTGPRLRYWNEQIKQFALEQGDWSVVDVGEYSRPVQDDIRLFDSTHCALSFLSPFYPSVASSSLSRDGTDGSFVSVQSYEPMRQTLSSTKSSSGWACAVNDEKGRPP
jgi:hypothetical protein